MFVVILLGSSLLSSFPQLTDEGWFEISLFMATIDALLVYPWMKASQKLLKGRHVFTATNTLHKGFIGL
jgi:hypothetical protein